MSAELALSDLLISVRDVDFPKIAEEWRWALQGEFTILAASRFGDLFCQGQSGKIYYLDVLAGGLDPVASSEAEILDLTKTASWREKFLRKSVVRYWIERGVVPGRGECLAPMPHPLLSKGKITGKPMVMGLSPWSAICSQLLEQLEQ